MVEFNCCGVPTVKAFLDENPLLDLKIDWFGEYGNYFLDDACEITGQKGRKFKTLR